MSASPDLSTFTSRLRLRGRLSFDTALRIGAARSTRVDEPDLPILRDALGRPYIPGSSFKGALRSYTESVLRTLQADEHISEKNLACLSVGKPERRPEEEDAGLCLHQDEVSKLKDSLGGGKPENLPAALKARTAGVVSLEGSSQRSAWEARLDRALRELSCWSCRVFGAPWMGAKFLIRDLPLAAEQIEIPLPREVRTGVAIDRDAGRAFPGQLYDLEVLPAGAVFQSDILVENASEAELGLLWLGLRAFENGEVPLGGAKSRGLGWCRLELDWGASRYVDAHGLVADLFGLTPAAPAPALSDQRKAWVQAFGKAVGALGA